MMKQIVKMLFFTLFAGFSGLAQHNFVISNNAPLVFYIGVPNQVEVARYATSSDEVRLTGVNGDVLYVEGHIFWLPYSWDSKLLIQLKEDTSWVTSDTVNCAHEWINPEEVSIKISPVTRHAAFPNLSSFDSVWLSFTYTEFAYLQIDSLLKLLNYEVVVMDSTGNALKTLAFDSEMSENERQQFVKEVRTLSRGHHQLIFRNFKAQCPCWRLINERGIVDLEAEVVVDSFDIVPK